MDFSEHPASEQILTNLRGCAADAIEILGRAGAPVATAAEQVVAIDAFLDRWQQGDRPPADAVDPADVPFVFGSLWGEAVVATFGWEWAQVKFLHHDNAIALGVLSPDRSMAIHPLHFISGCLRDPSVDVTISLSFNMLVAGKLTGFAPGGYTDVMEHVRRLVPRR